MESISPVAMLETWERGRLASPGERALLLLAAAQPGLGPDELAAWSVGRRDGALLALRERAFGPRLAGLVACPDCAEPLELELAAADIAVPQGHAPEGLALDASGYSVAFRLPNAGDLAQLARAAGRQDPERWLLERCVLEARRGDEPCAAGALPDEVLGAVADAIAQADPQADVELALTCPACGAQWGAPFDIVGFLWQELEAWAARTLREVHALASAYGWSEGQILALSPWRRRYYLELIAG